MKTCPRPGTEVLLRYKVSGVLEPLIVVERTTLGQDEYARPGAVVKDARGRRYLMACTFLVRAKRR